MIDLCDFIRSWQMCSHEGDAHRISTFVQMPSGSVLNLHVRPLAGRWVVSDGGAAIEEAAAAGIDKPVIGLNIRRAIRSKGLNFRDGRIEAPAVELASLQMAAIAVANTSRDVAEAFIYVGRDQREYSLPKRARQILVGRFHSWVSKKPVIIRGKSEKEHKFDTALLVPDGRKILVDTVTHHANAINSAVVANLDIRGLGDDRLIQRIVFDPDEPWKAEDITLLREGATPVSLEGLANSIERATAA